MLNNPNYKCSSPEVRDKIWKIAIELNYTPNTAARNLKMGLKEKEEKVYYVGVLMTRMEKATADPFFNELLRVIESEIHKQVAILTKVWYMPIFQVIKSAGTRILVCWLMKCMMRWSRNVMVL